MAIGDFLKTTEEKVVGKAKQLTGQQPTNNTEGEEVIDKTVKIDEAFYGTPIYTLHGNRGRHMFVFEDFVIIKTVTSIGSVLSGNATDGEKVLFYSDCIGVQTKEPGFTIGYIQLETASGQMNNLKSGWFNENTFTYDIYSDEVKEVHKFLFDTIRKIKK